MVWAVRFDYSAIPREGNLRTVHIQVIWENPLKVKLFEKFSIASCILKHATQLEVNTVNFNSVCNDIVMKS